MAAGWLSGLLGGGSTPDVQMPDGLPVSGGQGSPFVDAFLNLQGQRLKDAFTAPQRAISGDLPIWDPATGHTTEEAQNAASGMAGLAMTGSMPFKAPAGALRSFGGGQSLDDLLASMGSAIDQHAGPVAPDVRPMNRVDPHAASWDLYHGTDAPTDFARFDVNLPKAQRGHTPSSETGGVFLSPAADEAAQYSGSIGGRSGAEAGPRVIRTTVDPGRTDVFDLPHLMENDPAFVARARQTVIDENGGRQAAGQMFDERHARMLDEFKSARDLNAQLAEMGYPQTEVPQVQWGYGATGAAMQMARERGLDTAVLRGLSESNGGDQVVALTPGRVRSYYDPDHVLYSGGPGEAGVGLPAFAARAASPNTDQKGAPMAAGFGQLPSFADLPAGDLAALLQRLQQAPQDPRDSGPQAGTQGVPPDVPGLGGLLSPGIGSPPVAMDERQTQALERAQAGPQDLAALGGSPVDRLLFDRSGMGGGPGGFSGSADPMGPRNVPLPPVRPSDDALAVQPTITGSVSGMNPGGPRIGGKPPARDPEYGRGVSDGAGPSPTAQMAPVNSFDPLTGQPVSGSPRPLAAAQPSAVAPGNGQGGPQQSMMERFAQGLNNPDLSNLLMNISIGLLTNRGIPQGIGAGLQGYQQSRLGDVKQQLQLYQLQQQVQQQNATRAYLRGKGLSPDQVEAATLNPAILSSVQAQMNKDPSQITFGGNTYLVPPGGRPDASNLLGPSGIPLDQEVKKADALATVKDAHEKDDVVLQSDGQGGTIAVRKSSLFPDKASAAGAGEGGATAAPGSDPNIRTIVPSQSDKKANEGLDKLIGDNITGGYQKAQGAVGTLAAISRQKEALDKGVISGSGADWRTQAQAIGAQLLGIDPSQLNASYNFDAASTQKQAELAKAVSQAGHTTNMDLQLGKTIAGGDRSKTEQALRQIVDAQETLARHAIDAHNASLDRYAKIAPEAAARTGFFRVDTPEVYRYGQGTPNPLADPGARLPVPGDALGMARAAIARGAPRDAVIGRLRQNNIDPGNL